MRLIGEGTGMHLSVESPATVVIGWDRRPRNGELVDSLEAGLCAAGCSVARVGEVPTPGLVHAMMDAGADAGMMVTASHNPSSDSGVKLFDADGYKSMPEDEQHISDLIWQLADGSVACPQNDGAILDPIDGLRIYRKGLRHRLGVIANSLEIHFDEADWSGIIPVGGLIVDSSGGIATEFLAAGLSQRGLPAREVSDRNSPINLNCGAGGLSPTDSWSYETLLELAPPHVQFESLPHALLGALAEALAQNDGMPPWRYGDIVGAALDGDGDRCLLIEARESGLAVLDGDHICDELLRATQTTSSGKWRMAASIESDLGLIAGLERMPTDIEASTTAVGDRWLAHALSPPSNSPVRLHQGEQWPRVVGCEDSGHLVLTAPCPRREKHWYMVGDGAATLLVALCSRLVLRDRACPAKFNCGWKSRVSISPSIRERWDGKNALADSVHSEAVKWLEDNYNTLDIERNEIPGEPALLLITGEADGTPISIAVRNSGTEAKTSISVRAAQSHADGLMELVAVLIDLLTAELSP
uniref:Phosphoglucosamine mutase (GlmM) n=1 Tax=uncultured marine group II/III euryarchaeote KM3_182_B06 TaxID=1457946 RepID=A0A075GMW8_9EURY|nr:phosphoglucosamine mutase (glmM) [uncultured marine group II/III euryarchaeote KM3_182_B06]